MADATIKYVEAFDVTANSTSWVQVCTLANTNFTAGRTYFIVGNAFVENTSSSNDSLLRLVHGTTPTAFTDGAVDYEMLANTDQVNIGFMYVWTQPGTAEAITMEVSSSSTNTTTVRLGQILTVDLGDVGAENTDWFYTEDTADYTTTSSYVSKASITFTPNGTDNYLIASHACINGVQTTTNHGMRQNDSVAGALATIDIEGEDTTNEIRSYLMMCVVTPSAVSHTFSNQFIHESTGSVTVLSNRIFAVNLNKFATQVFSRTTAGGTPGATPTWSTIETASPTPSSTGNFVYWVYYGHDRNSTSDDVDSRVQVNPDGGGLVTDPNYATGPSTYGWDITDQMPWNMFKLRSLTSGGARPINLDSISNTGTSMRLIDRTVVAFSVALAGAAPAGHPAARRLSLQKKFMRPVEIGHSNVEVT